MEYHLRMPNSQLALSDTGTNIRLELFGQMLSAIAKGYGCTRAARFFRRDHATGVWRELLR